MCFVKNLKNFWEFGSGRAALAAFCAHSVSISIGICQGFSAILIPQLNDVSREDDIEISVDEGSWLASLGAISNPIGSILSGLLAEYFGRKISMQISSLPFILGSLCIGFSHSLGVLYTGRLITGIAAGMSAACYTYVSEISTPEARGLLQSLGPICTSFGILLVYTLGYFLPWRIVSFFSVLFSVGTVLAVQKIPESPVHLQNTHHDPIPAIKWLRSQIPPPKSRPLPPVQQTQQNVYLTHSCLRPLFILLVLFLLQELSGIYALLFYAVQFLQDAGFKMADGTHEAAVAIATLRLFCSLIAAWLLRHHGRRTLCTLSALVMSLSMFILAAYKYFASVYHWLEVMVPPSGVAVAATALNVAASMFGVLPVPYILAGELFPGSVRSTMAGVVVCVAQCFIFVSVKVWPVTVEWVGFEGAVVGCGMGALAAAGWCWSVVPETKDRTLEEIQLEMSGDKGRFAGGSENNIKKGCVNEGFEGNEGIDSIA